MIKAILFDFDGTLVDTAPGIVATLTASLRQMQKPVPEVEAMKQTIGLPLWKAFLQLGCSAEAEYTEAVDIYRQLFEEYELPRVGIFEGVKQTLTQLHDRGIRMAIVTSRDRSSLRLICENNDISQYFETDVAVNDGLTPKPAPDMTLALLERMGLDAKQTLVVGDTTFDILMGNAAQCQTCAVTYGNHSRAQLQEVQPTYMIDDFAALLALVEP